LEAAAAVEAGTAGEVRVAEATAASAKGAEMLATQTQAATAVQAAARGQQARAQQKAAADTTAAIAAGQATAQAATKRPRLSKAHRRIGVLPIWRALWRASAAGQGGWRGCAVQAMWR